MDRDAGQSPRPIEAHGMGHLEHFLGHAIVGVHIVDGDAPEGAEFRRDEGVPAVGGEVQVGGGLDGGDGLVLEVGREGFGRAGEGMIGDDGGGLGQQEGGKEEGGDCRRSHRC